MSTTAWVVLGVIVVIVIWAISDLQRPRRHAAAGQPGLRRHRRAAQAAPRPDPQSGRDGKGLCRARARNAGSGGPGAQRRDRRARRRAEGGGGEHAHRRAAAIVRAVGELSEPEGQRRTSSSCRRDLSDIENKLAASRRFFNNAVQEYNTGIQQFPAALFAGMFGFHPRTFFDLGEDRAATRAGAEREVLNTLPCRGRVGPPKAVRGGVPATRPQVHPHPACFARRPPPPGGGEG